FPRGFAPTFETEDDDEQTRQRRQKQVDEHAGTTPEVPDPVISRQRDSSTGRVPRVPQEFDPLPRPPSAVPRHSSEAPTELRGDGWGNGPNGDDEASEEAPPGVVRVPVKRAAPKVTQYVREGGAPAAWHDRGRRGFALLLTALVAVIAVGVATGLL